MGIRGVLHNIRTKGLGKTLALRRKNQEERERLAEEQRRLAAEEAEADAMLEEYRQAYLDRPFAALEPEAAAAASRVSRQNRVSTHRRKKNYRRRAKSRGSFLFRLAAYRSIRHHRSITTRCPMS